MLRTRSPIISAAVALISLVASDVDAAPQILGLVASNGMPTPLHCQDGFCTGYLASFCLQEVRGAPGSGSEYRLASGGELTLIATLPDGRSVRLPADDPKFRTRFRFSTVKITLPEAKLSALGAQAIHVKSFAVEVAPQTTILPVAAADDSDPQSPEEVADATGPLRRLAAKTFDRSGGTPDAARLVGLLINGLPPDGTAGPVVLDGLLRQVIAGVGPNRLGVDAIAQAELIAKSCQMSAEAPTSPALGACLDFKQFNLLSILNEKFWAAAGES